MYGRPIFSDPDGKRWRWVKRLGTALGIYTSLIGIFVSISILLFPTSTVGSLYQQRLHAFLIKRETHQDTLHWRAMQAMNRREERKLQKTWRLHGETNPQPLQETIGFYASWDQNSYDSLQRHIDALTYVMPTWLTLANGAELFNHEYPLTPLPPGQEYTDEQSQQFLRDKGVDDLADQHHVATLPVITNVQNDKFQWAPLKVLLTDPARQQRLADGLRQYLVDNQFAGINIDFELPSANMSDAETTEAHTLMHQALPNFIARLKKTFAQDRLMVTEDVPAMDPNYDYARLTDLNDRVIVMQYDQHTDDSEPGPIAGQEWIEKSAETAFADMDPDKTILGIGNFCYDWPIKIDSHGDIKATGKGWEIPLGSALNIARLTKSDLQMDEGDLNPYFIYEDADNQKHIVYMLDAVTAYNHLRALAGYEPRGAALWCLGSEDPTIWNFFDKHSLAHPGHPSMLSRVDFQGKTLETDTLPSGDELMTMTALPQIGVREFSTDNDGLITDESYTRYPTPYVMHQFDGKGKQVALTFDDGPDPRYTPKILRILREHHVHATFFVVGEAAAQHPDIVRQAWRDGNELGNHTYSHPHIAEISSWRAKLEINSTERIIESLTGHATLLFRAPYGDMPDTGTLSDLDKPVLQLMQYYNFLMAGMNIDPADYLRPAPQKIIADIEHEAAIPGNHVILLHDAGGDRTNTVRALPVIIEQLQQRGYRFVTIAELAGPGWQEKLFPAISRRQMIIAAIDQFAFVSWYRLGDVFHFLFLAVIVLGILRLLLMTPLAVLQRKRLQRLALPADDLPPVTVAIPAYNEEAVVCQTVQSVLNNNYPNLKVIVVDDGSKDNTLAVLQRQFGDHPYVMIIHTENGGKATALNTALELATTEIVVCMDGDTIFAPDAIRYLVRQFADQRVGAVAGNVKVGNRTNLLAAWQSIEYVTNQNFDRAAYSQLNAVAVIPGAIGAWRRSAVLAAGGFETSTLAEDADLTFKIRLQGYHTRCDNEALAYTEVPDDISALARQRFRWAFGILQALWKHRRAMWQPRYGAFSMVVMPAMWLFSFFLQALAPVVDIMVLLSIFNGQWPVMIYYATFFFVIDLITAIFAFSLDREDHKQLAWLFWQRLFYREFMYYIILRAFLTALHGSIVGWGKQQRKATVTLPAR